MQQTQGRELVLTRKNGTAVARILAASAGIGGRGAAASSFASLRVTLPTPSDSEPAETIVASLSYDAEGRPLVDQPEEAQQPPVRPATELSLTVRAREERPHLAGTTGLTTWVARLTGGTTFEVVASRGGFDGRETALLRLRIPEARRIHASYLFSDWWTRPAFPRQMADVPARTQFLLWERTDGLFCCLVPLVNGDLRATLQGAAASTRLQTDAAASAAHAVSPTQSATVDFTAADLDILVATEKSGLSSFAGLIFVLGTGPDPYSLVEAVYRRALQAINLNELAAETVGNAPAYRAPAYVARGRRDKRFPDVFEYLGWCSWDAFYQQVNAAGLLEKARELRSLQLPVRWVLIDDGWSPVQNRLLAGFGSDKEKFPAGLASVIRELKAELGFGWVGVWHALTGYWRGVDPAAPEMATVAGNLLLTSAGTTVPGFTPEAAFGFYHAWHSRLQQQGVDFIKVDNPGRGLPPRPGIVPHRPGRRRLAVRPAGLSRSPLRRATAQLYGHELRPRLVLERLECGPFQR
ncbi:MAG: hypothetical protein IMX00_00700 [Limnochordales bacterium]|nr:hypothetical protein [Limnochordales bacterium]